MKALITLSIVCFAIAKALWNLLKLIVALCVAGVAIWLLYAIVCAMFTA